MKINVRQSKINTYYDYLYIEKSLNNINENIELFSKLIQNNNITFYEYIDILNKLYEIHITDNDLLRISSIILNDNALFTIIKTNMTYDAISHIEVTNYFEYYEYEYPLYLKIAFSNCNIINTKHIYTKDEINKLLEENKIVLLEFILEEEHDLDFYEEPEYNDLYPINNMTYNNFINIKNINKTYIPHITKYLKSYFTKEKLEENLKTYMHITKIKLQSTQNYLKNRIKTNNNYRILSKRIKNRIKSL